MWYKMPVGTEAARIADVLELQRCLAGARGLATLVGTGHCGARDRQLLKMMNRLIRRAEKVVFQGIGGRCG